MAYGNVTPPTLPTYDAETNGYYLLVFNYELGADNWYMVHLIYGAWRFQYEEGVGVTNTGNTFTQTYSDGVWSEESQNTETLALNPGVNGQVYQRIYTNANIFNGDELWLAENTVTPLDEEQRQINMKSQLAGFIAGWCSPVRQFPKPEPVAYLYGHVAKEGETPTHTINGVGYVGWIGPKLPDTDFPFLVMDVTNHMLFAVDSPFTHYTDGQGRERVGTNGQDVNYSCWWIFLGEGDWTPYGSGTSPHEFTPNTLGVWTNYDILNEDGSVYLAASDPVPVYE